MSSISYILFYYAYVPHAAVSVPIYLQYAHAPSASDCPPAVGTGMNTRPAVHPYGTGILLPALASDQKYDVEVVLHMPRSPANLRAGNFMVDLALLAPTGSSAATSDSEKLADEARTMIQEASGQYGEGIPGKIATDNEGVVVRARRPAMLRYSSLEVDLLRKMVAAPWYALGWAHESERVEVGMLEDVEFNIPKARNLRGALGVPDRVRILLESKELLEVYSATVEVRARLSGLRWLMYKYRLLSFAAFTSMFYAATMGTAVAAYAGLTIWQLMKEADSQDEDGMRKGRSKQIKQEGDGDEDEATASLSDTSRTFPSRIGQEPLKYTGRGRRLGDEEEVKVKKEEQDVDLAMANIAPLEADYEDNADDYDDMDSFRDSGIGTSREDRDKSNARRRKRASGASGQGGGWDGVGRAPGL